MNLVLVEEVERSTDRNVRFKVELDVTSFPQVRIAVVTSLGLRQDYALALE